MMMRMRRAKAAAVVVAAMIKRAVQETAVMRASEININLL